MEELFHMIEKKIRQSGYPKKVSGEDVYNDLCDQMDEHENGTYLLFSKFDDDVVFEYNITIMDENFDLHSITIRTEDEKEYKVVFE